MHDEALIEKYRQGKDKTLLEELLRRNFDRIYRYVASMVRNPDCVDDLVQDVFLLIVRNIDGFRGESRFSTWAYRIAARRVYRHFETVAKTESACDPQSLEIAGEENDSKVFELSELNEKIEAAVAQLSPALRSAILLTCVEGFSPERAAEVEGCSVDNIHWRVHKARKILKLKLENYLRHDNE